MYNNIGEEKGGVANSIDNIIKNDSGEENDRR